MARISIVETDPGYRPRNETMLAQVYLDGVKQSLCVTADEETGEVHRYVTDQSGSIQNQGGMAGTEIVRGQVQIVWDPI